MFLQSVISGITRVLTVTTEKRTAEGGSVDETKVWKKKKKMRTMMHFLDSTMIECVAMKIDVLPKGSYGDV